MKNPFRKKKRGHEPSKEYAVKFNDFSYYLRYSPIADIIPERYKDQAGIRKNINNLSILAIAYEEFFKGEVTPYYAWSPISDALPQDDAAVKFDLKRYYYEIIFSIPEDERKAPGFITRDYTSKELVNRGILRKKARA